MNWKTQLLKDLKNVKTGKKEDGLDSSQVENAINSIANSEHKEEVVGVLGQNGLNWFASQLHMGVYDRFDVKDEEDDEEA